MTEILERILALPTDGLVIVVAIDGRGGAGKTTLAANVARELEDSGRRVSVVHYDDFYLPSARRQPGVGAEKSIWGDFDWERLRDEVLVPFRLARQARYARYDWVSDRLEETHEVPPGGVLIVEGVSCSHRGLFDLYDLRIWVDAPRKTRLRRGVDRDGEAFRDLWENDWMPAEDRYIREHRPDLTADIVVNGADS